MKDDDDDDNNNNNNNNDKNNNVAVRNSIFIKTKYTGTHKLEPQVELKYKKLNREFGVSTFTTSIFICKVNEGPVS